MNDSAATAALPALSVVIPVFNEEDNLRPLYKEVVATLESLAMPFEIIIVDDGSTDDGFARLAAMHAEDARLSVIQLRRNFGQTAAFVAGFDAARGEWVVTLDGDMQNDIADLPALLARAKQGFDIVSGWRVHRQDARLSRVWPSRLGNYLIGRITGQGLHDYGCSLKVYHRDVVKNIKLYGELHRFIPAVAAHDGVRVAECPVRHRPRTRGVTKYGGFGNTLRRSFRVFLDLIMVRFMLSYSTRPLHLFGGAGLLSATLGFALGIYLLFLKFFAGQDIGERPLLMLAVLLIVIGVQFISTGLMAEMVMRAYYESQGKPIYMIRKKLTSRTELSPAKTQTTDDS